MKNSNAASIAFKTYETGECEARPWGKYLVTSAGVTAAGQEYCKKIITIDPGKILSLQSHEYRRERWMVQGGALTAVLNGKRYELKTGESLDIPLKGVHCMANTGTVPCKVHERQEGICREEDTIRYADMYGRKTVNVVNDYVKESLARYFEIMKEIRPGG